MLNRRSVRALVVAVAAVALTPALAAQADQAMPNPPEYPFENPYNPVQEVLGKFLFWEEQLSSDNTVSCGTCHITEAGGSDPRSFNTPNPGPDGIFGTADDIRGSAGVVRQDASGNFRGTTPFDFHVQVTGRKTPSMINAVYNNQQFWDGRATGNYVDPQTGLLEIGYVGSLESQSAGPPLSDVEMAREGLTWDDVAAKLVTAKPLGLATDLTPEMQDFLATYPTYPDMFAAAYGDPAITSLRINFAIANYERSLVADQTPVDHFLKGNPIAPEFADGLALFQGKANCASCHTLPFSHDNDFHNIGVRPDLEDLGVEGITGNPSDRARFKTPNIRNAALRLPLFHNGGADSIADLIDFYNDGGDFPGPNLDEFMLPLNLTDEEKADLVHLVEVGFTDPRVAAREGPFSRPTLRSELPSTTTEFGVASLNGTGDTPANIAPLPAFLGNSDWRIGLASGKPSTTALMAFSFGAGDGSPFPDPRYPVPVNIDTRSLFLLVPTVTDADGYATLFLGIPASPVLAGFEFYGQWFFADPAALGTGGVVGTKGVAIGLFAPYSGAPGA